VTPEDELNVAVARKLYPERQYTWIYPVWMWVDEIDKMPGSPHILRDGLGGLTIKKLATNLAQAVDTLVPVLYKMEYTTQLLCNQYEDKICGVMNMRTQKGMWLVGTGATPSERMAWALCEIFLKVKEEHEQSKS